MLPWYLFPDSIQSDKDTTRASMQPNLYLEARPAEIAHTPVDGRAESTIIATGCGRSGPMNTPTLRRCSMISGKKVDEVPRKGRALS